MQSSYVKETNADVLQKMDCHSHETEQMRIINPNQFFIFIERMDISEPSVLTGGEDWILPYLTSQNLTEKEHGTDTVKAIIY